jgi:peptidoglycan/xylan/chitin deacetylase (PgdA/CDA1 family)
MGPMFTCSIDDGHPLDMRTAELLHKHGLGGTFFIPVRNREGFNVLSGSQIRELGRQFEIGSHTYDHCYLKNVDIWQAYYQVAEGKKHLEDVIGKEVIGFCYPGGRYRQRDVDLVRACGFKYARTTVNLCFDTGSRPYEMPTTVQFYPHYRGVYVRNFIAAGHWLQRQAGLRLACQHQHWIDRLYALFNYACEHGGTFHLWAHSSQIDELRAWNELDALFAHVAKSIPVQDRVNNAQLAARVFSATGASVAELF